MNITQAKAAMRKLFGKKAMWRYDESAPTAEQREAIKGALAGLAAALEQARTTRDQRRAELLQDATYRQLVANCAAAEKAHANALASARHYRVTIGKDMGFAFEVVAQGDNWQDAIDKAMAKAGVPNGR